jgi:hypothetical protein
VAKSSWGLALRSKRPLVRFTKIRRDHDLGRGLIRSWVVGAVAWVGVIGFTHWADGALVTVANPIHLQGPSEHGSGLDQFKLVNNPEPHQKAWESDQSKESTL